MKNIKRIAALVAAILLLGMFVSHLNISYINKALG